MKTASYPLLPLMVALALVAGCSTLPSMEAAPAVQPVGLVFDDAAHYGPRPAMPAPADLLQLTSAQQQSFLAHFNSPYLQELPPNERVARYLEDHTVGFHYQGETLGASDALARNGGNCMSLALLTTALADLAGVRIGFQLLDDVPVFEFHGSVVEKGYHVRSILYRRNEVRVDDNLLMLSQAGVKIDYFKTYQSRFVANLTRDQFIAMYYGNVAAAAIADGDYDSAYWYARESLQYAPDNAVAINLLAVTSRRSGDPARAEQLYRHGIEHADEKLSLLKNYRVLLQTQGRLAEAAAIGARLERMEDPSPFHWLQLARTSYDRGEYAEAMRYFRRALDMAPYMHEAYLGLAQSQYQQGFDAAARVSLHKALDNVYRTDTRALYKAKLLTLERSDG